MRAPDRNVVAELRHGATEVALNYNFVTDDNREQSEAVDMLRAYHINVSNSTGKLHVRGNPLPLPAGSGDLIGYTWDTIVEAYLNFEDPKQEASFWQILEFIIMPRLALNKPWTEIVERFCERVSTRNREYREQWIWFLLRHILLFHHDCRNRRWDMIFRSYETLNVCPVFDKVCATDIEEQVHVYRNKTNDDAIFVKPYAPQLRII